MRKKEVNYASCHFFILSVTHSELSPEKIPPPPPPGGGRNFIWGHLKSTVYESNPHTIQELKDSISHRVAAIKITMLYRVYLDMIIRAQLCIGVGGNHFQHLLWWDILSAFGCFINFCIYALLQTRNTFSWPTLYKAVQRKSKPLTPQPTRPQPDCPAACVIGLYCVSDIMDSIMCAGIFPKSVHEGTEEIHDFPV